MRPSMRDADGVFHLAAVYDERAAAQRRGAILPARPTTAVICSHMNLPESGRRLKGRGDDPGGEGSGMRVAVLG